MNTQGGLTLGLVGLIFLLSSQSFQLLSHVRLCDPVDCSTPGFPVHHQLLELAQTHVHQVGDAIQPSHPLLSLSSIFSNKSVLPISWPNYWSFSFSISPFIEYSGLISFSIARFDFFAIQGTLKSLPLHHSSKALILFFMAQISHPYIITWETIAWTIQTFVSKVTPLFFNTLS